VKTTETKRITRFVASYVSKAVALTVAANGPATELHRLDAAERVLKRHAIDPGATRNNHVPVCVEHPAPLVHPCPDIIDAGGALGIDIEEKTT
jgi:hypothetical protein